MSSKFINGAQYAVSTALGAAVAFTAATNAAPPSLSATTTADVNSIVVIDSGWTNLNETVARVAAEVNGVSFTLGNVDTTNTTRYPVAEGAGTYRIASAFVGLSQVRDVAFAGGEQNFFEFQYVEDANGRIRRKPTSKSAQSFEITLDYDPDLAWYAALIELDFLKEPVVLREILPGGDTIYYYGYISFNGVPTKAINENMTNVATFSLSADPIRYAA